MASSPPTKKTKLDEHSSTNPAPSDNTTSDDSTPSASGSNPTTSDNTTSVDSNNLSTSDDTQLIAKQYDMYFILHRAHLLKYPIIAFSDTKFNPGQQAVMQAGVIGCEITVYNANDPNTNGPVFGFLRLNTAVLSGYECRNPFRMMFSLNGLAPFLSDVASRDELYVEISVEEGSNLLSFQWANSPEAGKFILFVFRDLGSGHGLPFKIELGDVTPEQEKFPDVTYWLEAIIPTKTLRDTIREVMQLLQAGKPLTEEDFYSITTQKKVRTKPNYGRVQNQEQLEEDVDKILLNWVHWESLERASATANKCWLYLVTSPPQRVMVQLILAELFEVVYLIQADFLTETVDELPCLGHFRSLF